jgi:hypothetical protein
MSRPYSHGSPAGIQRIAIKFQILKIRDLKALNVPYKSTEKKSEAFER